MKASSWRFLLPAAFALLLSACGSPSATSPSAPPGSLTPTPTDLLRQPPSGILRDIPSSAASPSASASATAAPSGSARPSSSGLPSQGGTPADSATEASIKQVVELGNHQQEQAITNRDPAAMKSTSTDRYFQEAVQINQDLIDNGVQAIRLTNLRWGPITITAGDRAEATTFETWRTTFSDGSTDESTDRNVYTLVRQGGQWKVDDDAHPDDQLDQPPGAPGAPSTGPSATPVPARAGQSHNWSGYSATGGSFTSVSATWIVPRPQGSSFGVDAAWVGIGGVRSRDLIQAGTQASVTGGGRVIYEAWTEMLPQVSHRVPLAVSPGDSVTVAITEQPDGAWSIDFKNNTSGKIYQTAETYKSSHSSAEWVEEAPSGRRGLLPLDNFGQITFTNGLTVKDGKTVNIAQAGGRAITMIDARGNPIAVPSALQPDGASFSVSRQLTPAAPSASAGSSFEP